VLLSFLTAGFLALVNHQQIKAKFNAGTDAPLLAFLGWLLVSGLTSINREETINEAIRFSIPVMAYFLAAYAVPGSGGKKALAFGIAIIILVEAAAGILELFYPDLLPPRLRAGRPDWTGRAYGTFVNYNHFAGLMELGIFLSFGIIRGVSEAPSERYDMIAKRIFFTMPSGIMILALVLCASRGGWAGFAAGLLFFAFIFGWREQRPWRRILAMAAVILVVVGSLMMKVNRVAIFERAMSLLQVYHEDDLSLSERLSMWKSGLAMVGDHPLTGTGWGTFKDAYPSYRRDRLFYGYEFSHNDYMQMAATGGVPALFFFLWFMVMVFREGFRAIRSDLTHFPAKIMPGVLAGLLALLAHEMVDFNLMLTSNALAFFMLCAIAATAARETP
jgi:O-antigen ligase